MKKIIPENNILIIDDDPAVLRAMVRQLSSISDTVYTASNISEAISILKHHHILKLICDYDLGANHPTGDEVVSRLRRLQPGIQHAAIFTGSNIDDIRKTNDIDRIFQKATELFLIRAWVKQ